MTLYLLQLFILDQGLKLGATWNGQVEGFSCEKWLKVKKVEVVSIYQVCQQLISHAVQNWHDRKCQVPASIGWPVYVPEEW